MRKSTTLLAGMALSALVMIGLTVSAEQSSASFTATSDQPRELLRHRDALDEQRQKRRRLAGQPDRAGPRGHRDPHGHDHQRRERPVQLRHRGLGDRGDRALD